jgi:UDP-2,3-diacylglucosamine hydrolase
MSKSVFIADAHLKNIDDGEYIDLLEFLNVICDESNNIKALYILGDLFDFFIAFPQVVFYQHMPLLCLLEKIAQKGIKVFYFEGNHDFFLKKINFSGFPIEIVEKALSIRLNGFKCYICHGDLANPKDYQHHLLSSIVRNPLTYMLAYILPPHFVYHFAHWFSSFSRKNISGKKAFDSEIFKDIAPLLMKKGYKSAILGHFHVTKKIEVPLKDELFQFWLVGSWKEDRSYLLFDEERKVLEAKNFNRSLKHL